MNVITMGAHILDVLVRPVTGIPHGQETALVEQMRMTAKGRWSSAAKGVNGFRRSPSTW
jgi:hypothetical protein